MIVRYLCNLPVDFNSLIVYIFRLKKLRVLINEKCLQVLFYYIHFYSIVCTYWI